MWRDQFHRDQSGAALVFALLAVIILGGLAALFVSRAVAESRATGQERDFEAAIHVAESGLDTVIKTVNQNGNHVTKTPTATPTEHEFGLALNSSEDVQRNWAIALATQRDGSGTYTGCQVVDVGHGEACGIRPKEPDSSDFDSDGIKGEPLPWMFGVGFIPTRDAFVADEGKVRVVKILFDKGLASPEKAILANGSLTVGSGTSISGPSGSVHTNGNITVQGGSGTSFSGPVTSTGTYTTVGSPPTPSGSGPVAQKEPIPAVHAIGVYSRFAEDGQKAHARDSAKAWANCQSTSCPGYPTIADWYDLCKDGTVRVPFFTTSETSGTSASDFRSDGVARPCQSPWVLYNKTNSSAPNYNPSSPSTYNGWSYSKSNSTGIVTWSFGGNNSQVCKGAYYVHEGNVAVSGGLTPCTGAAVNVTILIDAHGNIDPNTPNYPSPDGPSPSTCGTNYDGDESGSLRMTGVGAGSLKPYILDLLYLADRDLELQGNSNSTELNGVMMAHEQIGVNGTPSIKGSVVAEDACDRPDSPVHANTVSGNFSVYYDGTKLLPLASNVRITYWSEF